MSRKKITEKQVKVYRQSRNGGKTYKRAAAQPITWKNCGFTEAKSTHN